MEEKRPTKEECLANFARIVALGVQIRDSLPPREAAEAAAYAGGPSVEELERRIIADRAQRHSGPPEQ